MHDGRCPIGSLVVRHVAAYCGENDDPVWTQLESHVYEYKLMFYYSNLLADVKMSRRLCADDISSRVLELDQSTSGSRLWRICARLSSGRVPVLLWTVGLHTWFVCASHCYFTHNIFYTSAMFCTSFCDFDNLSSNLKWLLWWLFETTTINRKSDG